MSVRNVYLDTSVIARRPVITLSKWMRFTGRHIPENSKYDSLCGITGELTVVLGKYNIREETWQKLQEIREFLGETKLFGELE